MAGVIENNVILDFGNIVSELETKNLKLLKIKDNNSLFVVDGAGYLYGIETYYVGGYLDRFIGEKLVISFELMEQPARDFEDWRKEFMDASWVKSFIERVVKKEYPNFKETVGSLSEIHYGIDDKWLHGGQKVKILNEHFKGHVGTVQSFMWTTGEYVVTMENGHNIPFRPSELEKAEDKRSSLSDQIQSASTRAGKSHSTVQVPVKEVFPER